MVLKKVGKGKGRKKTIKSSLTSQENAQLDFCCVCTCGVDHYTECVSCRGSKCKAFEKHSRMCKKTKKQHQESTFLLLLMGM